MILGRLISTTERPDPRLKMVNHDELQAAVAVSAHRDCGLHLNIGDLTVDSQQLESWKKQDLRKGWGRNNPATRYRMGRRQAVVHRTSCASCDKSGCTQRSTSELQLSLESTTYQPVFVLSPLPRGLRIRFFCEASSLAPPFSMLQIRCGHKLDHETRARISVEERRDEARDAALISDHLLPQLWGKWEQTRNGTLSCLSSWSKA